MPHRKGRETNMQLSRARPGNQISCCLVSLHFLFGILTTHPVYGEYSFIWLSYFRFLVYLTNCIKSTIQFTDV